MEEPQRDGSGEWVALEDFTPLPHCLEWRLANQYWNLRGPTAFFGGDVPYVSVNDGRLSADAARFLAEIRVSSRAGPVRILEAGGGSGLFAKLFLDELRIIAPALYDATTYLWTDASPQMVRQAESDGIFTGHTGRVRARVMPVPGMSALGDEAKDGFDLVIASYLLDNLPATSLRLSHGLIEEMEVRTTLRADLDASRLRGRTPQEWRARAMANGGEDHELIELYPWFSLECRHRPVNRAAFPFASVIPDPANGSTVEWTHHEIAWRWFKELLPLVRPGGGVLVNDYGHFPIQQPRSTLAMQHYGGSLATGINFEELSSLPHIAPGWRVTAPATDARQIHSRWIGRNEDELSAELFRVIFDGQRRNHVMDLLDQAKDAADKGSLDEAASLFQEAHRRAPRCWHLLARWVAFCLSLHDWESAHHLAEAGLKLHSRFPSLWNLKGDALYELKRYADAEACYRRAIEINPHDVRGRLNLSYVCVELGRYSEALDVIAQALALDTEGDYREALLERQRQVLLRVSLAACDALRQQINRFRDPNAPDLGGRANQDLAGTT